MLPFARCEIDERRSGLLLLIGATVVGGFLRLATVEYFSLFGDELSTLAWTQRSVSDIMSEFRTGNTMHLYILLMSKWVVVFGTSPLSLRFPSLLAGILLIPGVYILGSRYLSSSVGTLAAVMVAVSFPLVKFSRVARVYAILTLVVVLVLFLFLKHLRTGSRQALVGVSALNAVALALSLHSLNLLLIQTAALIACMFMRNGPQRRRCLGLGAAVALAGFLAVIFYWTTLPALLRAGEVLRTGSWKPDMLWTSFVANHLAPPLLLAVLLAVGALVSWRRDGEAGRVLVFWAFLPPLFYFLQRPVVPEFHIARFLVPTVPAHLLLIATAVLWLVRKVRGNVRNAVVYPVSLALVVLLMLSSPVAGSAYFREAVPTSPALQRLTEINKPGDVLTSPHPPYSLLISLQTGFASAPMPMLTRHPARGAPGRLIILTRAIRNANELWSDHYRLEIIGDERFNTRLFLLVSEPFEAGPTALREPIEHYLRGLLEAVETGARLRRSPFHHNWEIAAAHEMLAELARTAGENTVAMKHRLLEEEYRRRARSITPTVEPGPKRP